LPALFVVTELNLSAKEHIYDEENQIT